MSTAGCVQRRAGVVKAPVGSCSQCCEQVRPFRGGGWPCRCVRTVVVRGASVRPSSCVEDPRMWDRRRTPGKGDDGRVFEVLNPGAGGLVTWGGFGGVQG